MLQLLRMMTIVLGAVVVYQGAQLYAECTLTEWSAWGPCTDSEVVPSLFAAAASVGAVISAAAIAR